MSLADFPYVLSQHVMQQLHALRDHMWSCGSQLQLTRVDEQSLLRYGVIIGKSCEARVVLRFKFLKLEVYEKYASLVPILKWSRNESTTFMCQEYSNW